jgi:hypothetical protein
MDRIDEGRWLKIARIIKCRRKIENKRKKKDTGKKILKNS